MSTEGRAGYYRLVASGHGAALAVASQHVLASIAAADPEAVASHGEVISKACSQLIALADLLTGPDADPVVAQKAPMRPKRTRGELQDEAVAILAAHKAATGKQMSSKNLAKALTLAYAVALDIRAEIRDRTGEAAVTPPTGSGAPDGESARARGYHERGSR